MANDISLTILPQALNAFSFNRVVLSGPNGCMMHKTVHQDLRDLDFISTQSFICYLINGRERFFTDEGEMLTLHSGDLIAVPKDLRLQSDFVSKDGPLQAILIFFSDRFLQTLTAKRKIKKQAHKAKAERIGAHASLTAFMKNIVDVYEHLSVNDELVHSKMSELLFLLEALHDGDLFGPLCTPESTGHRNLRQVMRVHEDINLTSVELAALSGRSIASFNRDFRKIYGTSYKQWQICRKLDKARELLKGSNHSITDIALEVGYDSVSYFTAQFHKVHGMTPFQYRKVKCS